MSTPIVKSGKFYAGTDLQCGENVIIDVAEEVIVGDRCTIPDNAYFCGRRTIIGHDFYGYSWEWQRLDIGRGRKDDEYAVLTVGDRCTFHNNRIDLARQVYIGDDVGLSPDVVIYTHYYWQSPLDGYRSRYASVMIESNVLIGFRSVLLPGAFVGEGSVVGAQSVVVGTLTGGCIYGGSPARHRGYIEPVDGQPVVREILAEYTRSCRYRGFEVAVALNFPFVRVDDCEFDLEKLVCIGSPDRESEVTDDFRDFLFKHGIRIYTKRPFKKLPKRR